MGGGKVGKTSTIRNPNYYNWKSIFKYELSVQRVKNSLPSVIYQDFDPNQEVKTKYKLDFEKELLSRTVSDEKFIETIKGNSYGFAESNVHFRIYDFDGKEIFSSVHHILMNSNSLYFVVFNMTKISENDLFRLKF
eukprot:snap_masked-scaffold_3-processed-gene-19.43-mRNA-1 protein AED:1.00 eAED:1.00 QI:0/0/0/0/1/1/2/0/135